MEQQYILNSMPLPPVRLNAPKRLTVIDDESKYHLQCLLGDSKECNEPIIVVPKNNRPKLSTILPYHKRKSQLRETYNLRRSTVNNESCLIASKTSKNSIQSQDTMMKPDIKQSDSKGYKNKTRNDSNNHKRHKTFTIVEQNNFCKQINAKCSEVYGKCIDLTSSINQLPQSSLEITLKTTNEKDNEYLNKLLNPKQKKKNGNNVNKPTKILRETEIISKVSNELAYDARGLYNDIFLSNPKPIDHCQAKEKDRTTKRRQTMIDTANKIIQSSQYQSKKCIEYDQQ